MLDIKEITGTENEQSCISLLDDIADQILVADVNELEPDDVCEIGKSITQIHLRLVEVSLDARVESDDVEVEEIRTQLLKDALTVLNSDAVIALQSAYSELADLSYKVVGQSISGIQAILKRQDDNKMDDSHRGVILNKDTEDEIDLVDQCTEKIHMDSEAIARMANGAARLVSEILPVSRNGKLAKKFEPTTRGKKGKKPLPRWVKEEMVPNTTVLAEALQNPHRTIVDDVLELAA